MKAIARKGKTGDETLGLSAHPQRKTVRAERERVLVEFPQSLLERADEAAARLEKSRSELIRTAVEQLLEGMEKKKFEAELAEAYAANAGMNLELAEEFAMVDREGF
jgi:metal-responsive CopG/Arc/MetJ family transcriptional regulator